MAAGGLLRGVENDRLVEEIELDRLRRQPLERPARAGGRFGRRRQIVRAGVDLVAVDRRAPQEAGLLVSVVGNHLEKQADGLIATGEELHDQARVVAELGAPVRRRDELLEAGGGEVAAAERRPQSFEGFAEAAGIEVPVGDDLHGREHTTSTTVDALRPVGSAPDIPFFFEGLAENPPCSGEKTSLLQT